MTCAEARVFEASPEHEQDALLLLDGFRTFCSRVVNPEKPDYVSTTAVDGGGRMYREALASDHQAVFLAECDGVLAGIVTVYLFPQIRKGTYGSEVEEFFVREAFRGRDVAGKLMLAAIGWARSGNAEFIRLESGLPLARAHAFYQKIGFEHYAKGFLFRLG